MMPGHLRLETGKRETAYACGVQKLAWESMFISSSINPYGVTCGNCMRTKAYAAAMKAAK